MAAAGGLFAGRLALITGGGSGIGRAVCQGLASQGARVAVVDLNSKGAQETCESLNDVTQLLTDVESRFTQAPCININCAGITRDNFLLKMDEASFDQVMNVNMKGTFLVTQAVSRLIAAKEIPNGAIVNVSSIVGKGTFLVTQAVASLIAEKQIENGAIVNVSSISGKIGNIGQCNYAASKAGVLGFTKTAAKELSKFGIRCNAVLPGFIITPMTDAVPDKVIEMMKKMIPLGRMGTPEEVADVCLFLASQQSKYITGECIEVTGGFMM